MPLPTLPRLPPESPREARARRAVEAILGVATVVAVLDLATSRGPPEAGPPWRSIPVDVARDGPGRLRLLPGLGPTRVSAILADRRAHGPVPHVESLARIHGIGEKTLEALRAAGAVAAPIGERRDGLGASVGAPEDPSRDRTPDGLLGRRATAIDAKPRAKGPDPPRDRRGPPDTGEPPGERDR